MLTADQQVSDSEPKELPDAVRLPSRSAFVTNVFVALNVAAFFATIIAGKFWPHLKILKMGSSFGALSLTAEPWRFFTSIFLHLGLGHLLGNLLFLWVLGRRLEQRLGKWPFLLFYLASGIAGNIAGVAYDPEVDLCGASPAIFGLAGGLISAYSLKIFRLSTKAHLKLALLVLWTAYSIYPEVGTAKLTVVAHAGGLLTGLILGAVLDSKRGQTQRQRALVFIGMACLLLIAIFSVREYYPYLGPLNVAMQASKVGRTDGAVQALQIALQKRPKSLLANVLLTEAYLGKENYTSAELAVRNALAIDNRDAHANYLLGMVRLHRGYCEEAHQIGDQLLLRARYQSDKDEAWSLSVAPCDDAGFGDRFLDQGRPDLAIGYYKEALSKEANSYRAQRGLAAAYRAAGMLAEAQAADAKATAMQPKEEGSEKDMRSQPR